MARKKSVVTIGGGTGTHTILKGLKHYQDQIDITAIVTMADSGGSTGRLRDEFGILPIGDVRMALCALADDRGANELLLRDLFLYRFENGNGLSGHNLGNLLLTALTDILGEEAAAVSAASSILRICGRVLPVTADDVHLVATYDDQVVVEGEHAIDAPAADRIGHRIVELQTKPRASVTPEARAAILGADLVVIGPGDLYSSLIANLVVDGVKEALCQTEARLIFVSNLMERSGQTEGMGVGDTVKEITAYAGRVPDAILVNSAPLPPALVAFYREKDGTKPVIDDLGENLAADVVRADLLSAEERRQNAADAVSRSLIRHDPDKLARAVIKVVNDDRRPAL